MKKLRTVLGMLLLAAPLLSTGQTIRFDTASNAVYCNVQPVLWKRNKPNITRLYIVAQNDNLVNGAVITWIVKDSVYVDANTTLRTVVDNGSYVLTPDDYQQWDEASQYLFTLTAQKLNLTLK